MDIFLHDGLFRTKYSHFIKLYMGKYGMDLNLQFGYGMMEHSRALVKSWGEGLVILSPRDLNHGQILKLSKQLRVLPGANVVVDPQFYSPYADHERLCQHDFWPSDYATGTFFIGEPLTRLIRSLNTLNKQINSSFFITPGLLAKRIEPEWLEIQRLFLEEARNQVDSRPIYQTIALSDDASRNTDGIAEILENCIKDKADGYYIVAEHPKGDYLVEDPIWIANILDLSAGLKLAGAKVVIGYCNHQMLLAAATKADAIASGTWMNVRSFPPEKFRTVIEEEIKQRATWYYCPQALSEYKIPFLDIAARRGILNAMSSSIPGTPTELTAIFRSGQPSTIGLSEQSSFRHYLNALRHQVKRIPSNDFSSTIDFLKRQYQETRLILDQFNKLGVKGQGRDFSTVLDATESALGLFESDRGPMMRRRWKNI